MTFPAIKNTLLDFSAPAASYANAAYSFAERTGLKDLVVATALLTPLYSNPDNDTIYYATLAATGYWMLADALINPALKGAKAFLSAADTDKKSASKEEQEKATAAEKTPHQLTKQHTELLDQLFYAIDQKFLSSRTDISVQRLNDQAIRYGLGYEKDKALDALVSPLIAHMNAFLKNADLKAFKENCEKTFKEAQDSIPKDAPSFGVQAYDAVVCLFRALFRIFDYLATTVTGSKQLMRDTETPFAQSLTGKLHFFEYNQTQENAKTAGKLKDLTEIFSDKITALETLESSTSSTANGL